MTGNKTYFIWVLNASNEPFKIHVMFAQHKNLDLLKKTEKYLIHQNNIFNHFLY